MSASPDKMPVLFLLGTLEIGGSESKFVALAKRLWSAGDPVHVGYLRGPFLLLEKLENIPNVHLEQSGKWSLHAYRTLRHYVRRNRIQAIVTVNPYPLTYAAVGSLNNGHARVRVIASINTSEFLTNRDKRFMRLYAMLLRRCDHIIFGSAGQRSSWIESYRLGRETSSVIYNGVDSSHFSVNSMKETKEELRRRLELPPGRPILVSVGQLRPEKGHLVLLSVLARLATVRTPAPYLLLVGEGKERETIEAKIEELGLERCVKLVGATRDVRPYLKAADLFVLSSIAVETFSNAALEAAAMGLPIVMSDVGGAREMFPDNRECIIYPRDDKKALAKALNDSLDMIEKDSLHGAALRERVQRHFSTRAMDQSWRHILWEEPIDKTESSAKMPAKKAVR